MGKTLQSMILAASLFTGISAAEAFPTIPLNNISNNLQQSEKIHNMENYYLPILGAILGSSIYLWLCGSVARDRELEERKRTYN